MNSEQLGLGDEFEGIVAPDSFLVEAENTAVDLARRMDYLTTDDIWTALMARNAHIVESPSIMGVVMKRLFQRRVLEPTALWKPSERPVCHRRPVRVWASLVYGRQGEWPKPRPRPDRVRQARLVW